MKYAIRIPANDSLERDIAELLPRPVGRPSEKPLVEYKGFLYQAASWQTAWRVVAKAEHHAAELFPRVGFIVTNLTVPSRAMVRFYNKRGTAEVAAATIKRRQAGGVENSPWRKDDASRPAGCQPFRSNEVRLWAERDRLQPWESVAAVGAAAADWELVADKPSAAVGEDGRAAGETRPLLLAAAGRESFESATLRRHAVRDSGATLASGVGERPVDADFDDEAGMGGQGVGITGWKGGSLRLQRRRER